MAMDSPLRRWRRKHHKTQAEVGQQCGVTKNTVARWEQAFRVPRGAALLRLMEVTGLTAEALMFPERYLQEHPHFLSAWAEQPPRRGRPRRPPPEEEQPA
jgi:transcriptional regulator with XRE-family HTH domain